MCSVNIITYKSDKKILKSVDNMGKNYYLNLDKINNFTLYKQNTSI